MSKLSPALKALIWAPGSRPAPVPPPARTADLFREIAADAARRRLGTSPWLVLSAAASVTLNAPDALASLHSVASSLGRADDVWAAELVREVGLKCISFNGIPRTINCLVAFRAALPPPLADALADGPSRVPFPPPAQMEARGRHLWQSVYRPLDEKLLHKLALAHPDLPGLILHSHYGALLADAPSSPDASPPPASVGRLLTSVLAIACLRAQTGVGPQLESHVFGLRKVYDSGQYLSDPDALLLGHDAVRWLTADDGNEWILRTVDRIVHHLGGTNFAPRTTVSKF